MVNVLIPITDKRFNFNDILSELGDLSDVNVFVGITEDIFDDLFNRFGESENIYLIKFQKGVNREEILNALQKYVDGSSTLIMRKPITIKEFENFVSSKKDIVTCKRHLQKIKALFLYFWQKLLKLILGVKQYEGDPSVIYFSEDASAVLATTHNFSFTTRAYRWHGVEQGTVEVKNSEVVRPKIKKIEIVAYSLIILFSIITSVVVTVCVSLFTKVNVLFGILLLCLNIVCLAVIVIVGVLLIFNILVGKKNYGTAMELSNIDFTNDDYEEIEEVDIEDYENEE